MTNELYIKCIVVKSTGTVSVEVCDRKENELALIKANQEFDVHLKGAAIQILMLPYGVDDMFISPENWTWYYSDELDWYDDELKAKVLKKAEQKARSCILINKDIPLLINGAYWVYNCRIGELCGTAVLKRLKSGSVGSMSGCAQINDLYGDSKVEKMHGHSKINIMRDTSKVENMYGHATVDYIFDDAQIVSKQDAAKIENTVTSQ